MSLYSVERLIAETRRLAADYRRATGKTLPVSGEIAVHDALRLLGLDAPAEPRAGVDAQDPAAPSRRYQVKGRVLFGDGKSPQRIGQFNPAGDWDAVLLVLMDEDYEPQEIFEADREAIEQALEETRDSRRSRRGAMSVARFKIIGRRAWSRDHGREDDGYWDNHGPTSGTG